MAALLLSASNRQKPAGAAFAPAPLHSSNGLAFMIPDVPWWDSTAVGWAGTDPDVSIGLGHGPWEQVVFA
jgi:hypothetical protein